MGSTWIDKTLNGVKKMTFKINNAKSWLKLASFCAVFFFSTCLLNAMGQVDTSVPDRAYCVDTGNLYAINPGVNSGKPVCQFPDNSWCDAHAFFTGNCTENSRFNSPLSGLDLADATRRCQADDGRVENVHTPYGDVNLCVFPDGSSIDLRSLGSAVNYGIYGMPSNGIYYTGYNGIYNMLYSGSYTGTRNIFNDANAWYYGAYAFLNSP
jgi:putative hemolysin